MSATTETETVAILRRLEPAIRGLDADMRGLRTEMQGLRTETHEALKEMREDLVMVRVTLASKPDRSELWAMLGGMVALFALSLGGLAIFLQWLGK